MDDNLKKLIEQTQPESLSTIRLCKRLGYRPEDLVYKSLQEFDAVNQELRQTKFEHYKQRVLKIVQEINTVRSRNKTTTLSEFPSQTLAQHSAISEKTIELGSQETSVKQKVLQNLIYQELLRQKKFAEYYQQKKQQPINKIKLPTASSQHTENQRSSLSTRQLKTQQSYKIINQELELKQNPGQIQRDFKQKDSRFCKKKRSRLKNICKKQPKKVSKQIILEQKVTQRLQQFKRQMQLHSKQSSCTLDVKLKREQLENDQYQQMITKYCEKLVKLKAKESPQKQTIRPNIQIRNNTQSLIYNENLQQQINNKIEKVANLKSEILTTRSRVAKEKLRISQEDVNFNKYHNEQLKLKDEQKLLGKLSRNDRQRFSIDLKKQVKEKQKNELIWHQVNKVGHLFASTVEFEKYRTQMKLLLNKQRESLDPKYQSRIDILYQLLPQQLAEQVLQ